MIIMEEIRLKNRPSYYWEDIIKFNNIDLNKIKLWKGKFLKHTIFVSYGTEIGQKPLGSYLDIKCREFLKQPGPEIW